MRDDESILTWLSLHFRSCCLPQVWVEACISLQANWERSKVWIVRTMFGELKVQLRNESVRRTVRSMFGEQTFAHLRTGFRQEYMKTGWFILQCMLSSLALLFFQSIVGLMDYFESSSPRKIQISWSRSFLLKTSFFVFFFLFLCTAFVLGRVYM